MNKSVLSPFWEYALKHEKEIDFHPSPLDSTHFIVSCLNEEDQETIGHVYVELEGDDFKYISTNGQGKELFPPTTDFNLVEKHFEKYARFLALHKIRVYKQRSKILNHIINLKNKNTMTTQTKNTAEKNQKQNQLRFIEYEKPKGDGHFITVGDSYHNVLGRVHKSFNEETKKYEYIAFDHAGNMMAKGDKLWEVKNEFVKNRETLLEQAHQRRIESKEKSKEAQPEKSVERKNDLANIRNGKSGMEKQNAKGIDEKNNERGEKNIIEEEWNEREEELDDIRNGKDDDRSEMDMDR